ncbi:hypothetical protein CP02DC18_1216B, partial [Chlamydia psittaci 02DC18]
YSSVTSWENREDSFSP